MNDDAQFPVRQVLAIEPYFGGSHRAFLEAIIQFSRHDWSLLALPARHWKWRMRHAPLSLAKEANRLTHASAKSGKRFDLVFASEMLDLPTWRGFGASMAFSDTKLSLRQASWELPAVVYFHENQWTYPVSPQARPDAHYGYTNLLTAIAAEEVWFNSRFHQQEFLQACQAFVRRMPDAQRDHDFVSLGKKCHVIPPGFRPVEGWERRSDPSESAAETAARPLRLGWVSRWEDDKRPDLFLKLLDLLVDRGFPFELVLLGTHRHSRHPALLEIETRYGKWTLFNGEAETRSQFEYWLTQMDVVVSTADHEFFGIGICEAISAGAVPLVPNRLCYPEWIPLTCLYDDLDDAANRLTHWAAEGNLASEAIQCREAVSPFEIRQVVRMIDQRIDLMGVCPKRGLTLSGDADQTTAT